MSYSKCAMPSLSCLLSFYTIPISLFFNSKIFLFSSIYTDISDGMISMHSTATSMADVSSVISIKSLKVTPTLQAVPKLLVISTAVPIGVGVVLLIAAVLSIALSLYFIHGKHSKTCITMLHVFIVCSVQLGGRVFPPVLVCEFYSL